MIPQIYRSMKMAWKNLSASKFRTFLTILGIVIGIASVILVMSVGASAQQLILGQIRSVGSNLVGILPGASEESGPPASAFGVVTTTLTMEDVEAIIKQNPHVLAASGYVSGSSTVSYKNESFAMTYQGVSAELPLVESIMIGEGRFFTADENKGLSRVVVLGSERAHDLFGDLDPLGKTVSFGDLNFSVVGVLEERGSSGFSNPDQTVYVPVTTAQKLLLGIDYISLARMKVDTEDNIPLVTESIRNILRDRHDLEGDKEDDFSVRSTAEALSTITNITNVLKYFLTFVAGISLFVGGIGIMNIMLIALKQRIREVGLRKALGARNADIQFQFLVESVFISLAGGVLGFLLGVGLTYVAAVIVQSLGYEWEFILTLQSALVALVVVLIIGIFFGLYPAKKAAEVSPMEALRYE
ncbi:MAG: ABC transporter permease [Candidatus Moranbacteria bacterium]|nr:ABC transporter permease [Candidatus Moranbacteria bacterium]